MKIHVRTASRQDAPQIAPLFDAYRRFYHRFPDPDGALKYIRERLENRDAVIFIANDNDGRCLGFTQMYPTYDSLAMRPAWILYDLYVRPENRRQGIARKLMTQAAAHALETGASYIALETGRDNLPAQALYEELGYRQDPEFLSYSLTIRVAS